MASSSVSYPFMPVRVISWIWFLLLHFGDRLGVDSIVAEVLGRCLAPAAEVADGEQILDGRELCCSRLRNIRIDRAQAILREDRLRLGRIQEGHECFGGL